MTDRRVRRSAVLLAAAGILQAFGAASAQAQWCETQLGSIPIAQTQDDGQLAIDPGTRLLWVARRDQEGIGTDHLTAIDVDAGAVVAEIPSGPDPIAIAVNTVSHHVYVANASTFTPPFETSVSVYDGDPSSPTFLDELARIPTLYKPAGLAVDEAGGLLFVDTRDDWDFSSLLLAIDDTTLAVVAGEVSDARVYWRSLAFDPVERRLFVAREKGGLSEPGEYEVYDVDGAAGIFTFLGLMPYPNSLQRATGLGVDAAAGRLYHRGHSSSDGGRLEVWDTGALVHVEGFELDGVIGGLALDPSRDRLFTSASALWAYLLAVVDTDPLAVSHGLLLPNGAPLSIAVDPVTHRVYAYVATIDPYGARIDVFGHVAADGDFDGILDGCDNCPGDPNPDQADTDTDLIGDACDPDLDNDGCFNEDDQEPASSTQLVGSWISESCTPRSGSTWQTTTTDSDFDGELDCSDLDDDDDGFPDAEDPCPVVDGLFSCMEFRSCGLRPWWDVCLFSSTCREFFVKIVSVINPDPTIVFRTVEILNTSIWMAPDVETSLADAAAALGGTTSGFAARGAAGDRMRIELWSKGVRGGDPVFEALVAEYDPADLRIGDVSRGRWLVVRPPEFGGTDPTVYVDASWSAGGRPAGGEPDADGDGIPNSFDACLTTADANAVDSNADGFGNACDADYDGDGRVGASDEARLDRALGTTCADAAYEYALDRDSDCAIGATERDLVAAQQGGPPGPSGKACPPGSRGLCDHALPACANGRDDDSDGLADFPADPGCQSASSTRENPKCDDDLDNDGDGGIDWDGGPRGGARDPQCVDRPWRDKEAASACGFGAELALLLPLLGALRRRTRA